MSGPYNNQQLRYVGYKWSGGDDEHTMWYCVHLLERLVQGWNCENRRCAVLGDGTNQVTCSSVLLLEVMKTTTGRRP